MFHGHTHNNAWDPSQHHQPVLLIPMSFYSLFVLVMEFSYKATSSSVCKAFTYGDSALTLPCDFVETSVEGKRFLTIAASPLKYQFYKKGCLYIMFNYDGLLEEDLIYTDSMVANG